MKTSKGRGSKHLEPKAKKKDHGHMKDVHRAESAGRAAQGTGSAGRSGGSKSSGGRPGRSGHAQGGSVGDSRGGGRSGGGGAQR